jgi:hypothetical protein
MTVVKFPYNACRRLHSRRPRRSKNGTPEERAAKAAKAAAKSTPATVIDISGQSVIAGRTAAPAEQLDPWFEAGLLLKKLNDRKLLPAGVECMRLLLERHGGS